MNTHSQQLPFSEKVHTILFSQKTHRVFLALFNRGIGVSLQFIVNLLIAQLFGARGMGIYHIYSTWMVMLADISSLGLPMYTMRQISMYQQKKQMTSILKTVNQFLLMATLSCLIVSAPFIINPLLLSEIFLNNVETIYVLRYAAIAAVMFLLIRILSEALKAMGLTNLGILAESTFLPLGILLSLAVFFVFSLQASAQTLLLIHLSTLLFVLLLLYVSWKKAINKKILQIDEPSESMKLPELRSFMSRSLLFIWFGMILNIWFVNLPVFVLPYISSTEEIGLFGVAFRLVMLSTTILVSLSALFGPRFVNHYKENNIQKLKQELHHSQWYSLAAYLPFFLIFTIFPEFILSFFGEDFLQAKTILLILAIAQLVNSATGLVGYFLIMIHHEKIELGALLLSFIIMLPLMILLGNQYGIIGVTTAYALSIAFKNCLSLLLSLYFIRQFKVLNQ